MTSEYRPPIGDDASNHLLHNRIDAGDHPMIPCRVYFTTSAVSSNPEVSTRVFTRTVL